MITGGASGLGLLIAEVYGMRGASVAVLDVRELENQEARGVEFYRCDVGDRAQVASVAKQIEQDVRLLFNRSDGCKFADAFIREAWYAQYTHQQRWRCEWKASPLP